MRTWSTPSIGSSPRRKCRAGIGDDLLSFKKPLMTLLWNISRDLTLLARIGSAGRPESSRGRLQVLQSGSEQWEEEDICRISWP